KRLVAYYTEAPNNYQQNGSSGKAGIEELRNHLAQRVPEYMVPTAYVRLETLPLTPNGKLDRKRLPSPDKTAYAVSGYEEPQGKIETTLAAIWKEVLGVEKVGRHDNFFDLGGHSLLAVWMIGRLKEVIGLKVKLSDVFEHSRLSDLASNISGGGQAQLEPITKADHKQPLPLSYAQQRLWFLAQMEGVSEVYHISFGVRLLGKLNKHALRQALDRLVQRHEALRTTFVVVDGEPVQRIAAAEESQFALQEHDLRVH